MWCGKVLKGETNVQRHGASPSNEETKPISLHLEGGLFKRAQFREGAHMAHGAQPQIENYLPDNYRGHADRMHKPL